MQGAPGLSICIPAYDMGGKGAGFLAASFDRLQTQTYRDFEVIVSDQSDDEAVKALCDQRSGKLRITHVWNRDAPRQASANCNNALRHASGKVVKILFQDDILFGNAALQKIRDGIGDATWLLCGSAVTRDGLTPERRMVPTLHPQMHFGKNTVSSPSVLAFRRDRALDFDEKLIWLMDVDMYRRLLDQYGAPVIVPDTLVLNRLHAGQVSSSVTPALRRGELAYMRAKYKAQERLKDRLAYYKQVLKAR